MKFKKKEGEKSKYKFLRPEEIQELEKLSLNELVSEYTRNNTNLKAIKKAKKDDFHLEELKVSIKKYRENHLPDEVQQLKNQIKELKAEVDENIKDELEEKKDIEGGYRDSIKSHNEKIDVILGLMDKRSKSTK